MRGQHFTPIEVAVWLVEHALSVGSGFDRTRRLRVVDPACGDGSFLAAAARVVEDAELVGVELDPVAADACKRRLPDAQTVCADALALAGGEPLKAGGADLVVLNPPYVGEKGNRELFESVAGLGPLWASRTAARMDYLYYFLHLGLDLLAPGGRMVALTTAYWPSATSARLLRADVLARAGVVSWIRFGGSGIFADAPGQHNLAVVLERRRDGGSPRPYLWLDASVGRERQIRVTAEHHGLAPPDNDDPWQPFVDRDTQRWLEHARKTWPPLSRFAQDLQGVVSGFDRVTPARASRLALPVGSPVFMLDGAEVRERGWHLDPSVRPLLEPIVRGSSIGALDVKLERPSLTEPGTEVLVYLDRHSRPPLPLLQHLEPARSVLDKRREVVAGTMPWWGLHWPRDLDAMRRPKLITARRGHAMRFCLDLSGCVVSSDCTLLTLRRGADDLTGLVTLWLLLHLQPVERLMRAHGKHKGKLMELYREPLQSLPVPIVSLDPPVVSGEVAAEVRELARRALERLTVMGVAGDQASSVHQALRAILVRLVG